MKSFVFISLFVSISLTMLGCKKDKVPVIIVPPELCPDTISFAATIQPLINANCTTSGCHDAAQSGGYQFLSYASIEANATDILHVIRHDPGFATMPLGASQLPADQIQQFDCWIKQGKLDN